MQSTRAIFFGMSILVEGDWVKDHALFVEDRIIKAIAPIKNLHDYPAAKRYEFPNDYYLLPGWIDLHIHGAEGHDVMDGSKEAIAAMSYSLAKEGVTGFLATTMTAENDRIESVLPVLSDGMQIKEGAAILGVHLEGPFISAEKKGAQQAVFTQKPDLFLLERWQQLAQGAIKLVTLAPELPGSLELVQRLRDMGILVSVGHTNATFAETEAAIKAGCTHATHLFNAMRGIHHREPGAVGALLLAPQVMAELVADGLHLHPAMIDLTFKLKGKERLILVTDAMRAKCLGEGSYDLGGQRVMVREGKATLSDGTLAGSTLRMPQAIKNMMQFTQCTLAAAIDCASYNPAFQLGLHKRKGSIQKGKDADLVVTNQALDVMLTMREGKVVYMK